MNYPNVMLRYLSILLLLTSCVPDDNYDLTQEIEGPHEPVVIVDDRPFFKFISATGAVIEYAGAARSISTSGVTLVTTADYITLDCVGGGIEYSGSGTGAPT